MNARGTEGPPITLVLSNIPVTPVLRVYACSGLIGQHCNHNQPGEKGLVFMVGVSVVARPVVKTRCVGGGYIEGFWQSHRQESDSTLRGAECDTSYLILQVLVQLKLICQYLNLHLDPPTETPRCAL
jgi:hypothetical protein